MENSNNNDNKKYPKSKNNFQCLSSCYKPNTWIIHPITLEYVTDQKNPFCAVNEWEYTDPETGQKFNILTDQCYNPSENAKITPKELEMNILIPTIDFNCEHFLKIYYEIFSFDDIAKFLEKAKYIPYGTKKRILDCGWKAYSKNLDIISEEIAEFYLNLIENKWITYIYEQLEKYTHIDGKTISFDEPTNKNYDEANYVEKLNFIKSKFINLEFIQKFLFRFANNHSDNWNTIESPTDLIKLEFVTYIEQKIKKTIKK